MFDVAESPISRRIVQALTIGISLFVWGFFLFPTVSAQKTSYYLTVILPFLMLTPWLRWRKPTKVQLALLLFVCYLVVAVFWSPFYSLDGLLYFCKCALLAMLLVWSVDICAEQDFFKVRLLPVFIVSGLAVGVYSLVVFSISTDWRFDQVMMPVWHFANQNRMAKVYGVLFLVAAFLLVTKRRILPEPLMWLAMIVSIVIVLLSRSSGALFALLACVPCYLLFFYGMKRDYKKLRWLSVYCGIAVSLLAALFVFWGVGDSHFQGGWSYRDEIWLSVGKEFMSSPLIGVGAYRDLPVYVDGGGTFSHEHNIFLAILRQSGVIGLVLFSLLLVGLFRAAGTSSHGDRLMWLLVLVFGLLSLISSGEYPLERPKESWLFYWLPIAMLLTKASELTDGKVLTSEPKRWTR